MKRTRLTPARWGYSLIEMVLVIGGVTLLLGMAAGLLHILMRLDRVGRGALADASTVSRLAAQFRDDVRASNAARPGEGPALQLDRPGGKTVAYAWERAGNVLRRDETEGGRPVRREAYNVGRLGPLGFAATEGWVTLTLARSSGRTPVSVEARLGKDARWDRQPGAKP